MNVQMMISRLSLREKKQNKTQHIYNVRLASFSHVAF